MKKNRRNLIIMLGVLAALAAGVVAEQVRQQRYGARTFLALDTNGLKRIERTCTGCARVVLQKRQGYWEIVEPYVARADDEQVTRLVEIAGAPVRHAFDPKMVDFDQSGLAHPTATLTIGAHTIDFGNAMPGQDRYAKSGDRIALVQDRFTALLTSPPEQFVDRRPLAGQRAVRGDLLGSAFTPPELDAFSTITATRVEKAPAVIGAHFIRLELDNGRRMTFNFDFRDGGVLIMRRGDPYAYILDRELAAKIGMPDPSS